MIIVELTLTVSQGARGHCLPKASWVMATSTGALWWPWRSALWTVYVKKKKRMEMSSEPYYRGTIISFDATCTGYFTALTKIFKN